MKINYLARLSLSYGLFLLNIIILIYAHYKFTHFVVLLYVIAFRHLNHKGYISLNTYSYILCIVIGLLFTTELNVHSLILILWIGLSSILSIKCYLPVRQKIKKLFKKIDKNSKLSIKHDKILQNNSVLSIGTDFRQSEIDWLCYKILLLSNTLTRIEHTYIDNEIFGQHIQVNIV